MAKNFMSSILDELMGRDRDALPDEAPKKMNWDDPEMCPFYLVCFCPHELFVNTKADLGSCSKFHDEQLKKKYVEEAPGYKKSLNESEFIRFAEKMIADIEGKIKRGKMRIALANGPDGGTYAGPGSKNAEKIALLTERINTLLEETEAAGCEGNVEKAQGLMKLCDQLKEEKEQLKSNEVSHPWNPDKAMQVCEVCGSYLIIGEAQHRLDDHIMGKQHVGFAMLRKNLEDVKKAKEKRDQEEREKLEKEREKRWAARNSERDRERSAGRSRSKDKRRDSETDRKSSRSDRDRDRTRDRDRDRSSRSGRDKEKESESDRDKRRRRSRSRDRRKDGDKTKEREKSKTKDEEDKDGVKDKCNDEKEEKDGKEVEVKDKDKDADKDRHRHRDRDRDRDRVRSRDRKRRSMSRDRDSKRRSSDDSKKSRDKRSRSRSKGRRRSRSRSRDRKDRDHRHSSKRSRSDRDRGRESEKKESNPEKSGNDEESTERAIADEGPSSSKSPKLDIPEDSGNQEKSPRGVAEPFVKPDTPPPDQEESVVSPEDRCNDENQMDTNGLHRELDGIPDRGLRLFLENALGK